MKTIYFVRHGKAVGREEEMPDFDRPLIERGIVDAKAISARLADYGIRPSIIVSSPAARALETAKLFAKSFRYPVKKIRVRMSLYEQRETAIAELIASLDNEFDSVMVVGHNPSIEECARFLTGHLKESFTTCAAAGVECKTETWKDIEPGIGKMVFFEAPDNSPMPLTGKLMRKAIERKLADGVMSVLSSLDPEAAVKIRKTARKSTALIAGVYVRNIRKLRKKDRKMKKKTQAADDSAT